MKNRLFLPFVWLLIGAFAMSLLYPQTRSSPGASERAAEDFSGWQALLPELWAYYSADAPSFVVEIDSTTDLLSVGMRVRLKQDSGLYKYFGVNKVEISPTKTYLTLYGGTHYTLANETITEVAVSNAKAPFGFPLEESYWSVVVSDTSTRTQSSPTEDTWYNLHASHQITIPIGAWHVSYRGLAYSNFASAQLGQIWLTLSTANNSASESNHNTSLLAYGTTAIGGVFELQPKYLTLSTKTVYYLNMYSEFTVSSMGLYGAGIPTKIRAVWAYL